MTELMLYAALLRIELMQMYYNTMVPIESGAHAGRLMKYGVITVRDLLTDLCDWKWLYAAGRMHKPIRTLHSNGNTELQTATQSNLDSAVRASLLQLPETFDAKDLYLTIAGLSYSGD
jgi:mitochondrial translocator assembly and maintenance protein 41